MSVRNVAVGPGIEFLDTILVSSTSVDAGAACRN
jgi:hypothetical protein